MTFVLQQGDTEVEIEPLGDDQFVSELYGFDDGTASLPDQLTAPDTATLFLWQDLSGLSLVLVHDDPDGETGGSGTFEFDLPTDDDGTVLGEWVVRDDPSMFDSAIDDVVEWTWGAGETAGGAFRGLTGIPFGSDLVIDIDSRGRFVPLSNPWHHKQRFDRSIEGLEPPVWVCVFADNADNFEQLPPDGQPKQAYTVDDGTIVPRTDGTEPTNDMYVAISPGPEETTLKFLADRAGFDNRLLFRDRVLVSNSTTEPPGSTYSLPGVGSGGFTFGLAAAGLSGLDSFRVLSGTLENLQTVDLALDEPVEVSPPGTPSTGRSASSTVVSYVPGLSENDATGGNDDHSAFPNGKVGLPPFDYSLDGVAVGDHVNPIEDDALSPPVDGDPLSAFLDAEKTVQGLSGGFNHYKFKNTIAAEFEASGTTIDPDQTVTIKVNTKLPEDGLTVHGDRDSLPSFDVQLFDPENPEPPSFSIVEEGTLDANNPFNPDELGDLFDSRTLRAHLHTRYLSADVSTFERDGETIEGLRVATLCGASSTFIYRRLNGGSLSGGAGKVLLEQDTPVIFSWIELSVLADGTKLVRMPHSSVFPKHAGYLGSEPRRDVGTKMDDSGLEVIYDTSVEDSGDGYTVAVNENENNAWNVFDDSLLGEVNGGADPFRTMHSSYLGSYREDYEGPESTEKSGLFETPVMAFGRTPDGEPMSRSAVLDLHATGSDEWYPLSPFDISYASVVEVTSVSPGRPIPGLGLGAALAGVAGAGAWRAFRDGDDGQ